MKELKMCKRERERELVFSPLLNHMERDRGERETSSKTGERER